MSGDRPGGGREAASLAVRVRGTGDWSDARVRNISPQGMFVASATVFARGTVVELQRGRATVIARVVWAKADSFGVEARDPIDVEAFTGGISPGRQVAVKTLGEDTAARRKDVGRGYDDSRSKASLFQFSAFAAGALAGGYTVFAVMSNLLHHTFVAAATALGGA